MKTIAITGVTSGIGLSLIHMFLKKGEYVIGISRSKVKLIELDNVFKALGYQNYELVKADFSHLTEIEETSTYLLKKYKTGIDVLINNAALVPKKKRMTEDHFETQFQVNHLAVVKLTHGLLPLLKIKKGIVITTSSNAHLRAKFDKKDLQALKKYHTLRSYSRSKLYNVLFTRAFNEYVYPKTNVFAYAIHPGLVKTEIGTKDTSKLYAWFWKMFTNLGISPNDAAQTYESLVYEHRKSTDFYFSKSLPSLISKAAQSDENRDLLWYETLDLLKINF